jgi:hypothetical protein
MSSRKKIQRISHSAETPDLIPSDFFLFRYSKRKLTEYEIPDPQRLESAITHIFDEIVQEILITAFETWFNRLELVIEHEGEYIYE